MTLGLPDDARVRLREDVTLDGCLLSGGSPHRVARLSQRAVAMFHCREVLVDSPASRALAERLIDLNLAYPLTGSLPEAPELTVVIPVRGRVRALDRLLRNLGAELPVIVVDDASDDPAALCEVTRRHGASIIHVPDNVGPAQARNIGLARVRTPVVAFIDSDVTARAGDLRDLARHFADPQLALIAPRVRGITSGGAPTWFQSYEEAVSSLDLADKPSTVRPWSALSWLPSACLLARVDDIGDGFDPALRVAEDVDLVWRTITAGKRARYEPTIQVTHDARAMLTSWLARKTYYGTGAAPLAQRHGDLVAPAVLTPAPTIAILALAVQRRWSFLLAIAALATIWLRTHRSLPTGTRRRRHASKLTALGVLSTAAQLSELAIRHAWPVTALACTISRPARRWVAMMTVVDAALTFQRHRPDLDPVRFALARRLDDAAYGLGVWTGAWRARTLRPLIPRWHMTGRSR